MSSQTNPEEFFPDYSTLPEAEKSRLAELADLTGLLNRTTVENMQNNMRVKLSSFNYFAPYLLGTKPVGDERFADHENLRLMWLGCSQSLQHDVDVYHDQTGEVLFTVPAYMDTDLLKVNPADLSGESFDRMRRRMESERNFPEDAVNKYLSGTHQRVNSLIQNAPSEERYQRKVRMWAKIYSFYGVDVTQLPGYDATKKVISNGQTQNFNTDNPFGSFGDFNGSL